MRDLTAEVERLQQEVEELRNTNQALLVYKQQLNAILNNAPVEIYLKDRDGRYLRINKQFENIFNVKNEEVVGLLPADVHDPELAASTRDHDLFVLSSGVVERREEQARLVNDQQLHTLLTIKFPVFDDHDTVDGLGAIVMDITERRQAEETLRRAQKMEALGELTGGIAHDFNNILGIVMGNLELLRLLGTADARLLSHVDAAYKGASRGAELTQKLLRFSQSSNSSTGPVCLNKLLNGLEALVEKSMTASIDTHWVRGDDLWLVNLDSGELEDAVINLALNALDAMADGGQLVFETANQSLENLPVGTDPSVQAGDYVVLSVCDSGQGMESEVLKRATEPFFTTKSASKGTGLGLSMVYSFVSRSDGFMDITSKPDSGSEIRLYFPRMVETIDAKATHSALPDYRQGTETILIVDDEELLVEVAVSHLQSLGYKTLTATSSEQALELLHANSNVDLLFADVIMPGSMNGHKLAAVAQETFPSLKALITSGYTQRYNDLDIDESNPYASLLDNLLAKPYDKLSLSAAVRNALDSVR